MKNNFNRIHVAEVDANNLMLSSILLNFYGKNSLGYLDEVKDYDSLSEYIKVRISVFASVLIGMT